MGKEIWWNLLEIKVHISSLGYGSFGLELGEWVWGKVHKVRPGYVVGSLYLQGEPLAEFYLGSGTMRSRR